MNLLMGVSITLSKIMNLSYIFKKKLILVLNCWKNSYNILRAQNKNINKVEIKLKRYLIYLNIYNITIKIVVVYYYFRKIWLLKNKFSNGQCTII